MKHGTRSMYVNAKCRCDDCTAANTAHHRSLRDREPPRHGSVSGYVNYGCRCDPCRAAGSVRNKVYKTNRKYRQDGAA